MAWAPKKNVNSEILQELIREEPEAAKPVNPKTSKGPAPHEASGPQWQVQDSKPTPFAKDFFLSHPDKVLGI